MAQQAARNRFVMDSGASDGCRASIQRARSPAPMTSAGSPVPLSGLRVLIVTYWGFDSRPHDGQLVVNADAAHPLAKVFRRLYALRFPIHHMSLQYTYGPAGIARPRDGDFTASFSCRQAVPSPCP